MTNQAMFIVGFCTLSTLSSASIVLPPDNLAIFRESPDIFHLPRNRPKTMDGKEGASDIVVHSDNVTQKQLWVDYLYPLDSEISFTGSYMLFQSRAFWWISYVVVSLYLIGLWAGHLYMKDRKPFNLKAPLSLWNLFLAIFSFIGTLRTGLQLMLILHTYGFEYTLCRAAYSSYGNGAAGLWTCFFIFSKYAELIDTGFLIARKRKVEFLHWYHHCSVLLYCWHAYIWEMPTGIYFVVMNFTVHTIMYFYYFLASVCKKPPRWALMVTILQLVQMAIGIGITVTHLQILMYNRVQNCEGHIPNLMAALMMYASYFILFAQFLFNRYCLKRDTKKSATKKIQ